MKSNIKFILAIILILASFVIAVMSYYMLPICIPIFVVGIILLWFSKAKSRCKILWTVLPILFYLPSSFIFLYLYNYSSEKTVHLPAHYSGNFYIIYNQPCGESIPGNFLKKQIHIPEDGILIVKNKREGGFMNYRFIHSNSSAVREEILLIGIKPGEIPNILGINIDSDQGFGFLDSQDQGWINVDLDSFYLRSEPTEGFPVAGISAAWSAKIQQKLERCLHGKH